MTRAVLAVLVAAALQAAGPARAAEPLGRLFFTPEQRQQLDVARAQRSRATLQAEIEEQAPLPEILTYHGLVRRSDGRNTVWINDRALNDGKEYGRIPPAKPRPDGSINLELPQSERTVNLKVGQSVEMLSGTVAEPFARSQAASKPPASKPAVERQGERQPGPESSASGAQGAPPPSAPPAGDKPPAPAAKTSRPAATLPALPIPPGMDRTQVEAQLEAALEQVRQKEQRNGQRPQ